MDLGSDSVLVLDLSVSSVWVPTCQLPLASALRVWAMYMVYGSFRGFSDVFMGLTFHLI